MNSAWLRWLMLTFMSLDLIIKPVGTKIVEIVDNPMVTEIYEAFSQMSMVWIPIAVFLAIRMLVEYEKPFESITYMAVTALVAEVPYDLMISGKFLDWNHQNPLLGLVLVCILMLIADWLCERFETWGLISVPILGMLGALGILGNIDYIIYATTIGSVYMLSICLVRRYEYTWINQVAGVLVMAIMFKYPLNYASFGALFPMFYNEECGFYNRFIPYLGYWVILCLAVIFRYMIN